MNVRTGAKERLFQTEIGSYEPVLGLLSDDGSKFVSRYENRSTPPNAFVRGREAGSRRAMSSYQDPAMALQGVKSQMVTYTRADGVQLRMTVHTPPGWTPDKGRLPALLWAYPQEFTDPRLAGQVTGSPYRFTSPGWSTLHMLFLTQGYAILDDPKMPIVGPGETANDTYVQQLVSSAQAAVDKAVEMGIVDRDRVIAGGHSYGAFMTANLLAHSDIFRAGIARSGAYNRTLTPFGFQNERRTFWEVPQLYGQMSPFFYADKIKEPILLIHGEADDNAGTLPDPVRSVLSRAERPRRDRAIRHAAVRGARLRGSRVGAAHRRRDAELGERVGEGREAADDDESAAVSRSGSPRKSAAGRNVL